MENKVIICKNYDQYNPTSAGWLKFSMLCLVSFTLCTSSHLDCQKRELFFSFHMWYFIESQCAYKLSPTSLKFISRIQKYVQLQCSLPTHNMINFISPYHEKMYSFKNIEMPELNDIEVNFASIDCSGEHCWLQELDAISKRKMLQFQIYSFFKPWLSV